MVERAVKGAAQLGGRGLRPQVETQLGFSDGPARQQVENQFARLGVGPVGIGDGHRPAPHVGRAKRLYSQTGFARGGVQAGGGQVGRPLRA